MTFMTNPRDAAAARRDTREVETIAAPRRSTWTSSEEPSFVDHDDLCVLLERPRLLHGDLRELLKRSRETLA
jgi:hypothetical protein